MPSPNLLQADRIGVEMFNKVNNHFNDAAEHGGSVVAQNTQTGTSYTLVLADSGKVVEMNNAAANTLTVPPNSSVSFPVGTIIEICQLGGGQTTIAQGAGVTVSKATPLTFGLRAQYSSASLRKRATDTWVLQGDLA